MVSNSRAAARAHRLRPLNVPQPISVEATDDYIPQVVVDGGIARRVAAVRELWRVDDEWWRHPISRIYADVVLVTGRRLVLFCDLATSQWFSQKA